jgi:hypothetical protein
MKARVILGKFHTLNTVSGWAESRYSELDINLIQTDYYLESIVDNFGNLAEKYDLQNITGALVVTGSGDYKHIWVTWDRAPYSIYARYCSARVYLYN